jgi:hypothetical protein
MASRSGRDKRHSSRSAVGRARDRASTGHLRKLVLGVSAAILLTAISAPLASARASHTAQLDVVVSGLPNGVPANVLVRGPDRFRRLLHKTTILRGAPLGSYAVSVQQIRIARPYRTIKAGSLALPTKKLLRVRVKSHQTVTVQAQYGTIRNANVKPLLKLPLAIRGPPTNPTAITVPFAKHPGVGALLTQMPTTSLPHGLLDIVTKVEHIGGRAVLGLRPASLTEVYPELNVDYSAALEPLPSAPVSSPAHAADSHPIGVGLELKHFSCNGPLSGYSFNAETHFDAGAGAEAGLSFHWAFPPVSASGRVELKLSGSVLLTFALPAELSCHRQVVKLGKGFTITVGDIPVYVGFGVVGGIRTTSQGFSATVGAQADLAAGFSFDSDKSPPARVIGTFDVHEPVVEPHGGGAIAFGPTLSVGIGTAEVSAGFEGDVALALTDDASGCRLGVEEGLSAYVKAGPLTGSYPLESAEQTLVKCRANGPGPGVPPVNIVAPSLSSETPQAGVPLGVSNGVWVGGSVTYSYQWERCDINGNNCTNIAEGTAMSYTPSDADVGDTLRAVVTATNSYGASSVTTAASNAVKGPSPVNTVRPHLSTDKPEDGVQLAVSTGTWANSPSSYAYQWLDCKDATGNTCTPVEGATSSAYTPTGSDVGDYLTAQVTATSSNGSGTAASNLSSAVSAGPQRPVISYPNFSGATGLQLNGAATLAGPALRLTPAELHQRGTVFSRTEIQPGSFETEFELHMHESNTIESYGYPADGIAFMLQPSSDEAIGLAGSEGGSMGYEGIEPSAEIEFDLYQDPYDPPVPYVSFMENGAYYTHIAESGKLPFELYGEPVWGWVNYDAETTELKVFAANSSTKPTTPLFTCKVNLAELLKSEYTFAGFTSGTGSGDAVQEVLNWQLTSALPTHGA